MDSKDKYIVWEILREMCLLGILTRYEFWEIRRRMRE